MMNEERFDQLLDSLRDEAESDTQAVKARVWENLQASAHANQACAQFRPDLPGYAAGTLLESRRLLLDDHLARCVECRKVLARQSTTKVVEMPRLRAANRFSGWSKWAVAAGVAAMTIYAGRDRLDTSFAPGGPRATVESVTGELRGANGLLAVGAKLHEGDVVRTAPGSRAILRLADGSAVEVNQQASLAVHAAWSGQTIQLDSGDVILQAAKQRRGHLRVRTRDSVASVKGTIFAVSTGIAGSLVAVAEGSVEVEQGSSQELLKPGQRKASSTSLAGVETRDAFAWSQNAEQYLALLADFAKIEQKLAAAPQNSRREAKLISSLPAKPMIYGAIPNFGSSLTQAIEDQLRQSAPLRAWWESPTGQHFKKLLDTLNTVTPHLGDEVVMVLAARQPGQTSENPLLLAEVKPGQRAMLEQALARLTNGVAPAGSYRVTDNLLLLSSSAAQLAAVQATLGQGAATPFAQEIARRYQRGAGWMLALNIEGMPIASDKDALALGADKVRHAFFEQRVENGIDQNEAGVSFTGARTGFASWIGAPAAAPSSEYVSSDAVFALSGVTKNPRAAFDEFVAMMSKLQPNFAEDLRQFEAMTGIKLGDDLAASLGSDFTFAIETPTLPMPGWTWSSEVLRPTALDASIRRFVDLVNQHTTDATKRMTFTQEQSNGRSWNVLKSPAGALQWTYDRGYLVASMDRAIAIKALNTRNGGFPLVRSAKFRSRLPLANSVHQSGFFWLNASQALQLLAQAMPALKSFAENREPVLIALAGENDRIVASSRTRLTAFLVDLAMAAQHSAQGPSGKNAAKVKEKSLRKHGEDEAEDEDEDEDEDE